MPHESTVAHEHEQRQSKEENTNTTTLDTVGEIRHTEDEVS